ncbi:unnamed protein product [Larinioides sclopetarius]|uniref:Uncharacterized protein n=1 Tax=Larinioides sclopetarius TaxID=280406 RepID=A0AAV2ANV6_9ARAC
MFSLARKITSWSIRQIASIALYRKDYSLISLSRKSIECIVNEFNHLDEVDAKCFYTEILKAVKEALTDDKIDCLIHLSLVLQEIGKIKSDECLKNEKRNKGIENVNLVSLACKNKAAKVLEYIFAEESKTLYNMSMKLNGVCEKELLTITDEFCHNAFYYAMRSNVTELVKVLVDRWQSQYSIKELDDILSLNYKELRLRNVSLTKEMQLFVQSKIVDFRSFETIGKSGTGNSWNQIRKRIELVVKYIQKVKRDFWDQDPDDNFIFIAEFIAKNIHVLKFLLRSTYDRLPWEEIEFCLIIFIRCCKNPSEANVVYNCVLNKKKLLLHLSNFSVALVSNHYEFETNDVVELAKSVKLPRDSVIEKITKKNSEFLQLYEDYERVRDFCSLEIVKNYADLVDSSKEIDKRKHLLASRVLQVMGEHLKNTLDSPKLSTTTANTLLSSLSLKTKEIITKLRDDLSHEDALFIRAAIEKKTYLLKNIQTDISKMNALITKMLSIMRTDTLKNLMKKIRSFNSFEDVSDIFGPFKTSCTLMLKEIQKSYLNTSFKGDFENLEELIVILQKNLHDKTKSEISLFNEIFCILEKEKTRFKDSQLIFIFSSGCRFLLLNLSQEQARHNTFLIPIISELCSEFEIPDEPFGMIFNIKKLVRELIDSVNTRRVSSRNQELCEVVWNISEFMNFQMGTVKWMDEFRETIRENKSPINHTLSENLLTLKLSQLKEALTDFDLKDQTSSADFVAFKGNMELRAITEMLVLDILCILKSSCSRNPFFLDSDYLVLNGRNLRNHLAHGNTLIDVCLEESSSQLLEHAKRMLTRVLSETDKKFDTVTKCDCIRLERTIECDLRIVNIQRRLFVALAEGDVRDSEKCVREGADVYGRD